MSEISEVGLYSMRPNVFIDNDANADLNRDMLSFVVEEKLNEVRCCKVCFLNLAEADQGSSYRYFDLRDIHFQKTIELEINENDRLFEGRLSPFEGVYPSDGPPEIHVYAEDSLAVLRSVRQSRSFDDVSEADVIHHLAAAHGLQADVQCNALDMIQATIAQVDQTDLEFIQHRARRYGAEVWVEGNTLYVTDRADRDGGEITLTYGQGLLSFQTQANLANQVSEVEVLGWDIQNKSSIEESANVHVMGAELTGKSGSDFLAQYSQLRTQRLVKEVPLNNEHARNIAEADYRANARRFVTGVGQARGNPNIRVGTRLTLQGLGDLFNGNYYVVGVRHSFDSANGYLSEFEVERADLAIAGFSRPANPDRPGREIPDRGRRPGRSRGRESEPDKTRHGASLKTKLADKLKEKANTQSETKEKSRE